MWDVKKMSALLVLQDAANADTTAPQSIDSTVFLRASLLVAHELNELRMDFDGVNLGQVTFVAYDKWDCETMKILGPMLRSAKPGEFRTYARANGWRMILMRTGTGFIRPKAIKPPSSHGLKLRTYEAMCRHMNLTEFHTGNAKVRMARGKPWIDLVIN